MPSLTFYGGVGEIGGNKFLLRDGTHAFLLDFGTPFALQKRYYEEYLRPRSGTGLLDFLEMGLLPPIRGIYRPDLETPGLWDRFPHREVDHLDGVLLSHAHLDHSGYISFLRGDIPIYASALTAFVAKAMQDTGRSDMEHEVCYFVPREHAVPKEWPLGALGTPRRADAVQRTFRLSDLSTGCIGPEAVAFWEDIPGARSLASVPWGDVSSSPLPLRPFPVDHSVLGATAWAVETSAGWVVYTGDIRFHGGRAELSHQFVDEAAALRPRVLLAEGTYVDTSLPPVTEKEVRKKALQAAREARGLVVADFAPRDIERLLTFRHVAQETGRRLVVLTRDAYLLQAAALLEPRVPPLAGDSTLRIYEEAKSSSIKGWEKGVLRDFRDQMVSAEEIGRHQSEYMVCFSFMDLNELPSIRPQRGSVFIYSSSEPHDEEGEIDMHRLNQWLEHFNIKPVGVPRWVEHASPCPLGVKEECGHWQVPEPERGLHASGHASGPELVEMVKQISPRVFIPIHTEKPKLYIEHLKGTGINVHVPSLREEVTL